MRERILAFVDRLRAHDLPIAPSETMDAVAAVGAAGVEHEVLREALAATLVKDEHDRPAFDALFEVAFPLSRARAVQRRAGAVRWVAAPEGRGARRARR